MHKIKVWLFRVCVKRGKIVLTAFGDKTSSIHFSFLKLRSLVEETERQKYTKL
jgi:hypothetical protein